MEVLERIQTLFLGTSKQRKWEGEIRYKKSVEKDNYKRIMLIVTEMRYY